MTPAQRDFADPVAELLRTHRAVQAAQAAGDLDSLREALGAEAAWLAEARRTLEVLLVAAAPKGAP